MRSRQRNTTSSYIKESKERNSLNLLKNLKISRIGTPIKSFLKRVQLHPNIKIFYKKKNKPSSKILASAQIQSQEMIEKFMRKRKSKQTGKSKETGQEMQDIAVFSHECLVVSEEPKKNKFTEIVGLLCLKHLNTQERESVIALIFNSQDRFHIPREKLTSIMYCNIRYQQQMIGPSICDNIDFHKFIKKK